MSPATTRKATRRSRHISTSESNAANEASRSCSATRRRRADAFERRVESRSAASTKLSRDSGTHLPEGTWGCIAAGDPCRSESGAQERDDRSDRRRRRRRRSPIGVDVVFGIPSVHNLSIYDALRRDGRIQAVTVRHEQGAIGAADGFARTTGRLGVCLSSTGPGAANAMAAQLEAFASFSRCFISPARSKSLSPQAPGLHPRGSRPARHAGGAGSKTVYTVGHRMTSA